MKPAVIADSNAARIDAWLHRQFPAHSRSTWQRLIREGRVLLRGRPCVCKAPVRAGDPIAVEFPSPTPSAVAPEAMPMEVLFEDRHLLVINKPPGLVVHPGAGHAAHTLVNALLHHCRGQLSGIGGVERPGIVHRLDQDTSGCLVVAKTDAAHQGLVAAFRDRSMRKTYLALVWGRPRGLAGKIEQPVGRHPIHRKKMSVAAGGRTACTHWRVREALETMTLLECHPLTGRTHQIRVHLASLGHPVVGDLLYGPRHPPAADAPVPRQMLHAWKLAFRHPVLGTEIACEAPMPADMQRVIARARTPDATIPL